MENGCENALTSNASRKALAATNECTQYQAQLFVRTKMATKLEKRQMEMPHGEKQWAGADPRPKVFSIGNEHGVYPSTLIYLLRVYVFLFIFTYSNELEVNKITAPNIHSSDLLPLQACQRQQSFLRKLLLKAAASTIRHQEVPF